MSSMNPPSSMSGSASGEKTNASPVKALNTASILDAARDGRVLSPVEALHLLQLTRTEELSQLRQAADEVRQRQVGDKVYYTNAASLYLTNYCELSPALYDYPRQPGEPQGFILTIDEIDQTLERAKSRQMQALYLSGGGYWSTLVIPGLEEPTVLKTYARLMKYLREQVPGLGIEGFSPDEVEFLSIVSDRNADYVLEMLQDLGLRALGGNGAEILVDSVRQRISPKKATVKRWFEIVSAAHRLSIPVRAKVECGPLETLQQRVFHLEKLRNYLQAHQAERHDAFWTLTPQMWTRLPAAMLDGKPVNPRVVSEDRLKLIAVARLFLGEVLPDQQAFWQMNGEHEMQDALLWGANGFGGANALDDLKFLSGGRAVQSVQEYTETDFRRLIEEAGRLPEPRGL